MTAAVIGTGKLKLIIAGDRNFNDIVRLHNEAEHHGFVWGPVKEIVSGCARGADLLGEQYSVECGIPVARFPANWEKFGKAAGAIRNTEMADYADALLAFLAPESKGTKNMIETAIRKRLSPIVIICVE